MSGAVGGVTRSDVPEIVAPLLSRREHAVKLTVRPERVGAGYTVEWTSLVFDPDALVWKPLDPFWDDTDDE